MNKKNYNLKKKAQEASRAQRIQRCYHKPLYIKKKMGLNETWKYFS